MFDHIKPSTILLVAALAYDFRVARRNRKKFENLVQQYNNLVDVANFTQKQAEYLATMLDRANVEITEFDRIAMLNLT